MKNIVVLDGNTLGNIDYNKLREFGKVEYYESTKKSEAADRIKDADIVIVNKVELREETLRMAEKLDIICIAATGYNNIDIEYAKSRGIAVTNVAGYSTNSVVQHTLTAALALLEKISFYDKFVKDGSYSKSSLFTSLDKPFYEISGKRWGIIGLGNIGRGVAKVVQAFGADVVYYSTSGRNYNSDYKSVEFEELLATCDIISIHAPLNEKTMGLINYEALSKMKKEAILINVGRGGIIIEADLAKAINEGVIAGAAVDVFEVEPIQEDNPLLHIEDKDKILLTPHMAWASIESRERLFDGILENIKAFYRGEIRNRVEV